MHDETGVVHIADEIPALDPKPDQLVMLHALEGFLDAGAAVRLAAEQLDAGSDGPVVASFDIDQLYDYRARRPAMLFVTDHFEEYATPRLLVRLLHDEIRQPYLLLSGPEPDVAWERFIGAVRLVIDRLGVTSIVSMGGVPMAVPHTRPVTWTIHGTRPNELPEHRSMFSGELRVPSSAQSLLEFRLGEWGYQALGFVAHVPHYLAQLEFPSAAAALLRAVSDATSLKFDLTDVDAAAEASLGEISTQLEDNDEVAEVVRALEAQYDAFTRAADASLLSDEGSLPTGEELGAEFERFLAGLDRPDDRPNP
jgi:hypothetical protein